MHPPEANLLCTRKHINKNYSRLFSDVCESTKGNCMYSDGFALMLVPLRGAFKFTNAHHHLTFWNAIQESNSPYLTVPVTVSVKFLEIVEMKDSPRKNVLSHILSTKLLTRMSCHFYLQNLWYTKC